jgi:hypothetical protein
MASGAPYSVLDPDEEDALRLRWREVFAKPRFVATGRWIREGFDWHTFSDGHTPALEEARARSRRTPRCRPVRSGRSPTAPGPAVSPCGRRSCARRPLTFSAPVPTFSSSTSTSHGQWRSRTRSGGSGRTSRRQTALPQRRSDSRGRAGTRDGDERGRDDAERVGVPSAPALERPGDQGHHEHGRCGQGREPSDSEVRARR